MRGRASAAVAMAIEFAVNVSQQHEIARFIMQALGAGCNNWPLYQRFRTIH
jgi:hypothetical protein